MALRALKTGGYVMAQYKLAFLGTGNMGGALVAAAANGGHGTACILSNRTPQKAQALAQKYGCAMAASNSEAAGQAQYILLGVKPQMMAGLPHCAHYAQHALRHRQGHDAGGEK